MAKGSAPGGEGRKVIKLEDMKKRADGKLRFADKEADKRHSMKAKKKAFMKKGDAETMKPEKPGALAIPKNKPLKKHKKG
jgi:hypothetical protein